MRFGELIPLIGALLNFSLALFVLYLVNYATLVIPTANNPATRPLPDNLATYLGFDGVNYLYTGWGAALNDVNGAERDPYTEYYNSDIYCHFIVSGGLEVTTATRIGGGPEIAGGPRRRDPGSGIRVRPGNQRLPDARSLIPDPDTPQRQLSFHQHRLDAHAEVARIGRVLLDECGHEPGTARDQADLRRRAAHRDHPRRGRIRPRGSDRGGTDGDLDHAVGLHQATAAFYVPQAEARWLFRTRARCEWRKRRSQSRAGRGRQGSSEERVA